MKKIKSIFAVFAVVALLLSFVACRVRVEVAVVLEVAVILRMKIKRLKRMMESLMIQIQSLVKTEKLKIPVNMKYVFYRK